MKKIFWQKAEKFNIEQKVKHGWNRLVRALAMLVVFCTVYSLIIPAITLENGPYCGKEEHTHTAACYSDAEQTNLICKKEEHKHTDACYDAPSSTGGTKYTCGKIEHKHTEKCYRGDTLICTISEHSHTSACLAAPKTAPKLTAMATTKADIENNTTRAIENATGSVALSNAEKTVQNITLTADEEIEEQNEMLLAAPLGASNEASNAVDSSKGYWKKVTDQSGIDDIGTVYIIVANQNRIFGAENFGFIIDDVRGVTYDIQMIQNSMYPKYYSATVEDNKQWSFSATGLSSTQKNMHNFGGLSPIKYINLSQTDLVDANYTTNNLLYSKVSDTDANWGFKYNDSHQLKFEGDEFKHSDNYATPVGIYKFVYKATITLNPGDAEGETCSRDFPEGETFQLSYDTSFILPIYTKTGYDFAGWKGSDGTEVKNYEDILTIPITKSVTFTAQWKAKEFTVSFDSAGGSSVAPQTVKYGEKAKRPADPSKSGFVLDDWYTDTTYSTRFNFDDPITGNITLHAKWVEPCTVDFDSNGGSEVPSQIVGKGKLAKKPADPVKEGFVLSGWYTDAQFTDEFDFNTPITEDITLYAEWEDRREYSVIFASNGGSSVPTQQVQHGRTATRPEDPTKSNSTFEGWFINSKCTTKYDFSMRVYKETTLYAKWNDSRIAVPRETKNVQLYVDETATINVYRNSGTYTYSVTSSDDSIASVTPSSITVGSDSPQDITIKANSAGNTTITIRNSRYTDYISTISVTVLPKQHTVTFKPDFKAGDEKYQIINSGSKVTSLPSWERTGWRQTGWKDENGNPVDVTTETIDRNRTFTAVWEEKLYTVTFKPGLHIADVKTVTIQEGSKISASDLPKWTEPGFRLEKWKDKDGPEIDAEDITSVVINKDKEFTALWTKEYTVTLSPGEDKKDNSTQIRVLVNKSIGSEIAALPEWHFDNHTRIGWTADGGRTVIAEAGMLDTIIKSDITYTAVWQKDFVTVRLRDGVTDTVWLDKNIRNGQTIGITSSELESIYSQFHRDNYTFANSWISDDGEKILTNDELLRDNITKDITFIALWKENKTVTFAAGYEGGQVESRIVPEGDNIKLAQIPTFTRDNYTFVGWSSNGGKNVYTSEELSTNEKLIVEKNITYTAQWKRLWKVTLQEFDNGTKYAFFENVTDGKTLRDAGYTEDNLPKEWYEDYPKHTLVAWSSNGGITKYTDSELLNRPIKSNTIFVAQWEENVDRKVTFKPNGAPGYVDIVYNDVESGKTLDNLSKPVPVWTREGYTFAGWKTEDSQSVLTKEEVGALRITKDTVFEAQWNKHSVLKLKSGFEESQYITYTIPAGLSLETSTIQNVTIADLDDLVAGWKDENHRFKGWPFTIYDNGTAKEVILSNAELYQTRIDNDTEITALWDEVYKVKLNPGTPGGDSYEYIVAKGENLTQSGVSELPEWPFPGFAIKSWRNESTGVELTGGSLLSHPINSNEEYTAQWVEKDVFNVTFKSGFTDSTDNNTVQEVKGQKTLNDVSTFVMPYFTRPNYVFSGWKVENGGGSTLTNDQVLETVVTGNITYVAQWEYNNLAQHKVTFLYDANQETPAKVQAVTRGSTLSSVGFKFPNWTKPGKYFVGWSTNGGTTILHENQIISAAVRSNITYVAQWQDKPLWAVSIMPGFSGKYTAIMQHVPDNETLSGVPGFKLSDWTRDGYIFAGWSSDNGETIAAATNEELMNLKIHGEITYVAQWEKAVKISFVIPEEYRNSVYAVDPMYIPAGSTIPTDNYTLPSPLWSKGMPHAFNGWKTEKGTIVTKETPLVNLNEDIALYAIYGEELGDAYFVYYCDFDRGEETLVTRILKTYAVGEKMLAPDYKLDGILPPEKKAWNEKWYLDKERSVEFDKSLPISDYGNYKGHNYLIDGKNLYLWPGTNNVWRVVFDTNGDRIAPMEVIDGNIINLDNITPSKSGSTFGHWYSDPELKYEVSGEQTIRANTTYYASWSPGYVAFTPLLQTENAENYNYTSAALLGNNEGEAWYAVAGSTIFVKTNGTEHLVWCRYTDPNGQVTEKPVYTSMPTSGGTGVQAKLEDVFMGFFLFCNKDTDEWKYFTEKAGRQGEVPYDTTVIMPDGSSIIAFTYIRVRVDVKFNISNSSGYMNMYQLHEDGIVDGTFTKEPSGSGNYSCTGQFENGSDWEYTAASGQSGGTNVFVLKNVKYNELFPTHWPTLSWFTSRNQNSQFVGWTQDPSSGSEWVSKRINMTDEMYQNSKNPGRKAAARVCTAHFDTFHATSLMYAVECLDGETPDFTVNGIKYKIDDRYTQYVNSSSSNFSAKEIAGCEAGIKVFTLERNVTSRVDRTTVNNLLRTRAAMFGGRSQISEFEHVFIFAYRRYTIPIQFDFHYGANGLHPDWVVSYPDLKFRQPISKYRYAMPDGTQHELLRRPNWRFKGWTDQYGVMYTDEDWDNMVILAAKNSSDDVSKMIFHAQWEPMEGSVIRFFENRYVSTPLETNIFLDGQYIAPPTGVKPDNGWEWTNSDTGKQSAYTGDIPLYGQYGVPGKFDVTGTDMLEDVYIIDVYGSWNFANVTVNYDVNKSAGGQEPTPVDPNIYTPGETLITVKDLENKTCTQEKEFAGWKLKQNGTIYQPGEHVESSWQTLDFLAQWIPAKDAVLLQYHKNDGSDDKYPESEPFAYEQGSTANVWDNIHEEKTYFVRPGYAFVGWNTKPDGSGKSYEPGGRIDFSKAPLEDESNSKKLNLYAQWKLDVKMLTVTKSIEGISNIGAYSFDLTARMADETPFPEPEEEGAAYSVDNETGIAHFNIGHGESATIPVPTGKDVIISETTPNGFYVKYTEGKSAWVAHGAEQTVKMDKDHNIIVHNIAGSKLPSTGGVGVIPFYALGGALIAGAAICATRKKRRKDGDSPP